MPFGPWPGVPGGGGGGVVEVDVTAPITKSGPVTQPIIGLAIGPGASLLVSAGNLVRGPLGKDVVASPDSNNVDVVAIEETSGPSRLDIGAIPDTGAGNFSFLVRPGGTASVVGEPITALPIVESVSVTAPIENVGTAQNPDIALGVGPGASLIVSAGNLVRGPLGKDIVASPDSNNVDVVAIEETSGPSRLGIDAIPDAGAGFASILVRPGGTATVTGESNSDLSLPLLTVVYHLSLSAADLYGTGGAGGWAFPGTFGALTNGAVKIEALLPPQARKVRMTANFETNTLSALSTVTLDMTRNGTASGVGTSIVVTAGATGHFDTGLIIPPGGTAPNDSWGLNASQPIQLGTGAIDATVTIFIY